MYISDQCSFEEFLSGALNAHVLAIDTEFLRDKTYFPRLCLLQLATENATAVVDPFAIEDISVMRDVLLDDSVVKLFHAGRQDLEILYHDVGVLPVNVFDTQLAAALLGHTQQMGLGALVQAVLGVSLKKSDSFTDWSCRPLTKSQLEYAECDVLYLPRLYEKMSGNLARLGRLAWLEPDFADLVNPANYESDPRERYVRLKRASHLSRQQLSAAREVAAWREEQALKRNIPRRWVLTDEQIVEACKREARTIDDLFLVRGIKEHLSTRDARKVVALLVAGLSAPEDSWPSLSKASRNERNVDAEVDLMLALVRLRAKENGIALQTLASHDDLADLARGHDNVALLRGWRKELIGNELQELLRGTISLSIENGALKVRSTKETE